jgi:HAD superfamily hydrolase (TIGR01459 family)
MTTKLIKGLNQVQGKYDTFFIDLWGVVHDGVQLNPGAIEVLENLNKLKKRFVLMSNAPRPSKYIVKFLLKLNMNKVLIQNVFTSGEATLQSLRNKIYGKKFYHLGPQRDSMLSEGFEENITSLDKADFILCTGFLENHEDSLDYYKNLLKKYKNLKMVCANPDLIVHRGQKQEYCAGTLAEIFKELGGEVIYFGKPYPEIYKFCIKKDEKILVIGDSIHTDIKGANNMNLDSLLITSGIHKKDFLNMTQDSYDKISKKHEVKINYYQAKLTW